MLHQLRQAAAPQARQGSRWVVLGSAASRAAPGCGWSPGRVCASAPSASGCAREILAQDPAGPVSGGGPADHARLAAGLRSREPCQPPGHRRAGPQARPRWVRWPGCCSPGHRRGPGRQGRSVPGQPVAQPGDLGAAAIAAALAAGVLTTITKSNWWSYAMAAGFVASLLSYGSLLLPARDLASHPDE